MGADMTLDAAGNIPERLISEEIGLADVVILCTSAVAAIDQAWHCVDKGGVIVFFAVPHPDEKITIPLNDFWTRETKIMTSYYCGPPDIEAAIDLIKAEKIKVDDMITGRLPLRNIAEGFQLVMAGKESLKIIIKPHQ
jgi:L-iditol 2-dehydrogenase